MSKLIKPSVCLLISLWVLVVVLSGAGWNPSGVPWSFTNTGAFGDSFGPLSAIMAGLAAIAAFETIREQRREFARVAERERREDQRRQEDDVKIERQRRLRQASDGKQLFERTFFNLLEALREIVKEIDTGTGEGAHKSRDAFAVFVSKVSWSVENLKTAPDKAWLQISDQYKNDLNHYFRFMYHIVLFVDLQEAIDRYFYVRLLRASLSEGELVLLALNCAYGEGEEKFKPLVEKWALLHNISETAVAQWSLRDHFDESAFDYGDT